MDVTNEVQAAADNGELTMPGEGNDTIQNSVSGATIEAFGGDDIITNTGNDVTIDAGDGNDTVSNSGKNVTITAGAGDDSIKNTASTVSIVGGAGNDSVTNTKTNVTIDGGDDNDRIVNSAATVTINGGASFDYIHNTGANVLAEGGDGYDTLSNGGDNSTLFGGAGNDSIRNTGANVLADVGEGDDTLSNDSNGLNGTLIGGAGNDYIHNNGASVLADVGDGDDTLSNDSNGLNGTLIGGAGNDYIHNNGASVLADVGDGDDYVYSSGANATISAGIGNDTVSNIGKNVTITTGAGDDLISLGSAAKNNFITYATGEGNDTIVGFNATSTLKINNGTTDYYSKATVGSDIIVRVGDEFITLAGAASLSALNILGTEVTALTDDDDFYSDTSANETILALRGNDTIKNGHVSYSPIDFDNAKIESSGEPSISIVGAADNDEIINTGASLTVDGGDGADTVRNYHGHHAVINGDADNDFVLNYNASNASIDGGAGNNKINNYYGNYTTIKTGDGDDNISNSAGNYATITAADGNDYISNSGTNVAVDAGAGSDTVHNSYGYRSTIAGGEGNDSIYSSGENVSIAGGEGNDIVRNFDGNFVTVSGNAGDDNISLSANSCKTSIKYAEGDGNDTVYGCNPSDSVNLTAGSVSSTALAGYTLTMQTGNGSVRFVDTPAVRVNDSILGDLGEGTNDNDYITNFAEDVTIDALAGNDTIANGGERFSVNAGEGSDTVHNYGAFATVNAGAGNDSVDNYTVSAFINGDAGNDKLYTYKSNDVTLGGGEGNDNLINERGSEVSLDGGAGSDTVRNSSGNRAVISGDAGADFLYNQNGDYSTIDGGDDNDYIDNSNSSHTSAVGGAGDDYIHNYNGNSSTLDGGDGNDSIDNLYSDHVSVGAGAGLDSVLSNSFFVTVDGGAANDRISLQSSGHLIRYAAGEGSDTVFGFNESDTLTIAADSYSTKHSGDNVIVTVGDDKISLVGAAYKNLNINKTDRTDLITLTKDNDIFRNNFANVTLNAGTGDDSVQNYASLVTLNGGDGKDSIYNNASNVTLNGDKDNDYISNSGTKASLNGGAGDDYLHNSRGNASTLNGGANNDNVYNYVSDNASLDGGAGNDSLYNYYSTNVTINGGNGNDSVTNIYSKNVTIDGGNGDDFLANKSSDNVTILGGTGNDSVENDSAGVLIDGGEDNDSLSNSGTDVTVDGGAGNDFLYNTGDKVSVLGGVGNDVVSLASSASRALDSTVKGGIGNDTVYGNSIAGGSYKYEKGEGKDIIYGFNTDSTLFISNSRWSTAQSGNDIIVTVSNGSVTLKDVAGMKANIVTETMPGYWTFSGTTATYRDDTRVFAKVSNLKKGLEAVDGKIEGISIEGVTVTLSAKVLDTAQVKISNNYILALADDVPAPITAQDAWHFSGTKTTTAKYRADTSAGYTVNADATAIDYFAAKTGKVLVTVTGLKGGLTDADKDGIKLDDTTVTLSAKVLDTANTATVTTKGYTLALADDVPAPITAQDAWHFSGTKTTTAKYRADTSAGYALNAGATAITYVAAKSGKTLVTVTGLKGGLTDADKDGIKLDDTTVTLSAKVLDTANTATVTTKGYTLALADDVPVPTPQTPFWEFKGNKTSTTVSLKQDVTAGYNLSQTAITYAQAKTNTLTKVSGLISGLTDTNGLAFDENAKTITVSENVLDPKNRVTVSGKYTLALGFDVPQPVLQDAAWSVKGTTAKYSANTTAGYNCTGKEITYAGEKSGKTIVAVSGLAKGLQAVNGKINGIELDKDAKIVTLSENVLDPTRRAAISKGYTLELDGDVPQPVTELPSWKISGTTAKYRADTPAGYKLNKIATEITYVGAKTGKTMVAVSGLVKGLEPVNGKIPGIALDEDAKTVTLSANVLDPKKIATISNGYTLDLARNVPTPVTESEAWSVSGTKATLKAKITEGYVLSNDGTAINHTDATSKALTAVNGLRNGLKSVEGKINGIETSGKTVSLSNEVIGNKVTIGKDYAFNFTADCKGASIVGTGKDDTINVEGANMTVTGGRGDDYVTLGAGNMFVYASGDGNDVIADFTAKNKLKITGGTPTVTTSGNDVIVSLGKGSIKLTGAAGQDITLLNASNKPIAYNNTASYLLADANYTEAAQLDTLVDNAATDYSLGKLDANDPTTLAVNDVIVTYDSDK